MQLTRPSSSKEISTAGGREDPASVPSLLEFQSPTAAIIALPLPAMARGTIWAITSMWVCFMVIISLYPIEVVVTTVGKVASQDQPIVLSPVETSIVKKIFVNENEVVKKGDLLAQLDPTFPAADKASLEGDIKSLTAETSRLQAEIEKRPLVRFEHSLVRGVLDGEDGADALKLRIGPRLCLEKRDGQRGLPAVRVQDRGRLRAPQPFQDGTAEDDVVAEVDRGVAPDLRGGRRGVGQHDADPVAQAFEAHGQAA